MTPVFDIASLQRFLDDSPTPHHVVASAARLLLDAGFTWFDERSEFPDFSGAVVRGFVARDGAIIAFATSSRANDRFNVVGAHTDSPGLHLKPRPEGTASNFGTLDVEVYGSPLLNSWLDRDLDLAGHVVLKNGARRLFRSNAPVARLPQLAIHLDRTVNESGLVLDKHAHLRPVWTTGNDDLTLRQWVARATAVPSGEIATVHAQLVDSTPASLLGADGSLLASGRLDNQLSCWAAITSLLHIQGHSGVAVCALFDHEEVGSSSTTGAAGPLLEQVLERIAHALGKTRSEYLMMLPASACLSCDNAHAVHPNYPDRHDARHAPLINRGLALKVNSNQRYASSTASTVAFLNACERARIEHQVFASRNNMPCGSTIGPITATRLGIDTVDVGVPQLSMHSAREVCGVSDALDLPKLISAFLGG
ncbi:MAG: M18 family aminopeptidase [Ilumatobacteraceae bacterium]